LSAEPIIVSHYGSRVIEWDRADLEKVLAQLQHGRHQHDLVAEADYIRANADQIIQSEKNQWG
jgi:hypothetical protein